MMKRLFRRKNNKKKPIKEYTEIELQALEIGEYYIKYMSTISETAKKFSLSSTTIWRRMELLKTLNPKLYKEVCKVKKYNMSQAPLRSKIAKALKKAKTVLVKK